MAKSANVHILNVTTATRSTPQAKYFVGSGKAEEIADAVRQYTAAYLILANHGLPRTSA